MLDKKSVADGLGGVRWEYTEGVHFRAGLDTNQSTEARIAYQTGAKVLYTLVHDKYLMLEQGDAVKRTADGLVLRIKSDSRDMRTPEVAQIQFAQVMAEVLAI